MDIGAATNDKRKNRNAMQNHFSHRKLSQVPNQDLLMADSNQNLHQTIQITGTDLHGHPSVQQSPGFQDYLAGVADSNKSQN